MIKKEVSFTEALRFWLKLGFIGFGGPAGQISIMHTELVEKKKWISENRFLHALNYCMMLPGPEAQQLATYMGWLLHGTWGGIAAGTLFIIPSLFLMIALSWIYFVFGDVSAINGILYGFKPAVVAIVAYAVIKIGQKAFKGRLAVLLAVYAFCALYFFKIPFPVIIISAGIIGWTASFFSNSTVSAAGDPKNSRDSITSNPEDYSYQQPSRKQMFFHLSVGVALWAVPMLLLAAWQSWQGTFTQMGWFFTKAALVTFGGAYAVLPYVTQNALDYHWLVRGQMIDGLALGETTPGPLIKIVAFVGFIGAWQATELGAAGAVLGALTATYFTFLPSFLFILLGAPLIEVSRGMTRLSSAFSGITSAVVGVIFNLAVFFGMQVFLPQTSGFDFVAVIIAATVFIGLLTWRWSIIRVVLGAGLIGMLYSVVIA